MSVINNTGKRQMQLGMFLNETGEHISAWRSPSAPVRGRNRFERYLEIARLAERALFDFALVPDVGARSTESVESLSRLSAFDRLDPIILLSALAASTDKLGLVGTASTTFGEPWDVARKMASLDHISAGRAGWNIVTSINDTTALNYGREELDSPEARYARAEEFVDVVKGLWGSWDEDALVMDKATGRYFEPNGMHVLGHKGTHFRVRGPLDVMRPPQGNPILVQAGSSPEGRALGARVADIIFSTHQTLGQAQAFCTDIHERSKRFGRPPGSVKVVMALIPVVGRTMAEAEEKLEALQEMIHSSQALPGLSKQLGNVDLNSFDPNAPLPRELPSASGLTSRRQPLAELGDRKGWTLMQLARWVAGTRGHKTAIGTPSMIADQMEEWFTGEGADGFLLVFPELPANLVDFSEQVLPELQRRGLFRRVYEAGTFRDRLASARS